METVREGKIGILLRNQKRHPTWGIILLLLIVLAGCGGSSPTASNLKPTATPAATTPDLAPMPSPQATPKVTASGDWTMYHRDSVRSGYVANAPDPHRLTAAWKKPLDGAVYAEPLVVHGHLIVATENDSLYALNASSGQVLWHTRVGSPVPLSTLPCGNIDPLGITGTPVYDPATNLIFAVAEVTGPAHILVALDANTGVLKQQRTADLPGLDPRVNQERGALALWGGRVYVAYGGLTGDCGQYYGQVLAFNTNGQGSTLSFKVPTPREGGIWAPPGPTIDSQGNIYVAVGNGATTAGDWDHSDSVLRLSPTLHLEDGFAPTGWQQENANDVDLGSMGPMLLPNGLIFQAGKSYSVYLLHAKALGGIGGQALVKQVCSAYGGAASVGSVVYAPCLNGVIQLKTSSGGTLQVGWQAPQNAHGSPIIGGQTVYTVDPTAGTLYAFNSQTGARRAKISIGETSRFSTPTLSGRMVFVGTMAGITAVNIA